MSWRGDKSSPQSDCINDRIRRPKPTNYFRRGKLPLCIKLGFLVKLPLPSPIISNLTSNSHFSLTFHDSSFRFIGMPTNTFFRSKTIILLGLIVHFGLLVRFYSSTLTCFFAIKYGSHIKVIHT